MPRPFCLCTRIVNVYDAILLLAIASIAISVDALVYDCPGGVVVSGLPSTLSFLNVEFSPINSYSPAVAQDDSTGKKNGRTLYVKYVDVGQPTQRAYYLYATPLVYISSKMHWVLDSDLDPTSIFAYLEQISDPILEPNPDSLHAPDWRVVSQGSEVASTGSAALFSAPAQNVLLECSCFGWVVLFTPGLNNLQLDARDMYIPLSNGQTSGGKRVFRGLGTKIYLYWTTSTLTSSQGGWHFDLDLDPASGVIAVTENSVQSSRYLVLDRNGGYIPSPNFVVHCAGCTGDMLVSGITGSKETWNGVYAKAATARNLAPTYIGADSATSAKVYIYSNTGSAPSKLAWGFASTLGASTTSGMVLQQLQDWLLSPPEFSQAGMLWQYASDPGTPIPIRMSCLGGPARPSPYVPPPPPVPSSTASAAQSSTAVQQIVSSTAAAVASSTAAAQSSTAVGTVIASSTASTPPAVLSSTAAAIESSTLPAVPSTSSTGSSPPIEPLCYRLSIAQGFTAAASNNGASQFSFLQSFVNRALKGNAQVSPMVTGVFNIASLRPFFTGTTNSRYIGHPLVVTDGSFLSPNYATNDQYYQSLLKHMTQFLGTMLGCNVDTGFPAYTGTASMLAVHKGMNITGPIFASFNQQFLTAASSYGLSSSDRDDMASALLSFARSATPRMICKDRYTCPCAPDSAHLQNCGITVEESVETPWPGVFGLNDASTRGVIHPVWTILSITTALVLGAMR